MARNPNIMKMKRQKYRKRRGSFKPFSVESTNDEAFIHNSLRKFWSERVAVPSTLSPGGLRAYTGNPRTLGQVTWLDTLFPGIKQQSPQRKAALEARVRAMQEEGVEPTSCVVISRTEVAVLYLYYNTTKSLWYWQEVWTSSIRRSITYSSKQRAIEVLRLQQVRWHKPQPETLSSMLNSS